MPEDWKAGLFKIAKKVDLSVCHNWRVITLLNLTSQFSKIMQERRTAVLEKIIGKEV